MREAGTDAQLVSQPPIGKQGSHGMMHIACQLMGHDGGVMR